MRNPHSGRPAGAECFRIVPPRRGSPETTARPFAEPSAHTTGALGQGAGCPAHRPCGMSEQALIALVLAGDCQAERELYDRHVERVYRLAFRMAGDDELAQEFTQDAFIRAFERLPQFRGEAGFATWLHAIAVSVTLNGLRRERRHRSRETDLDPTLSACRDGVADLCPMTKLRLKEAIDRLPEQHRTAFLMHDLEGYTHEEIGTVLAVATGTSKSLVSRARARLRAALADLCGGVVA